MTLRMTHTVVELGLSPQAWGEIHAKLTAAGYSHAFCDGSEGPAIDMTGIAVVEDPAAAPEGRCRQCDMCGPVSAARCERERTSAPAPEAPTLADARRYQWLRKHKHYALLVDFGFSHAQVEHWSNEQNAAKLDAAVDAARRAPAPEGEKR